MHGLTKQTINKKEELMYIIKKGALLRSTNSTTMNDTSSRSHAILQVFIETRYIEKVEEEDERGNKQLIKKRHH